MSDEGDDSDQASVTPEEIEDQIEVWVDYGIAVGLRAEGMKLGVPLGENPIDRMVSDFKKTIVATERLQGMERPFAQLYQRAMEIVDRKKGGKHARGFQLEHVPKSIIPHPWLLIDGSNGDAARRFAGRVDFKHLANVSEEDYGILAGDTGGNDVDDVDDVIDDVFWDVINDGLLVQDDGFAFTMMLHEGDVHAIPLGVEWDEEADDSKPLPGGDFREVRYKNNNADFSPLTFGRHLVQIAMMHDPAPTSMMAFWETTKMWETMLAVNASVFLMTYDESTGEVGWQGTTLEDDEKLGLSKLGVGDIWKR